MSCSFALIACVFSGNVFCVHYDLTGVRALAFKMKFQGGKIQGGGCETENQVCDGPSETKHRDTQPHTQNKKMSRTHIKHFMRMYVYFSYSTANITRAYELKADC